MVTIDFFWVFYIDALSCALLLNSTISFSSCLVLPTDPFLCSEKHSHTVSITVDVPDSMGPRLLLQVEPTTNILIFYVPRNRSPFHRRRPPHCQAPPLAPRRQSTPPLGRSFISSSSRFHPVASSSSPCRQLLASSTSSQRPPRLHGHRDANASSRSSPRPEISLRRAPSSSSPLVVAATASHVILLGSLQHIPGHRVLYGDRVGREAWARA
jgi:hypothetical protein